MERRGSRVGGKPAGQMGIGGIHEQRNDGGRSPTDLTAPLTQTDFFSLPSGVECPRCQKWVLSLVKTGSKVSFIRAVAHTLMGRAWECRLPEIGRRHGTQFFIVSGITFAGPSRGMADVAPAKSERETLPFTLQLY